ncbi:uncharacterized protein LOC135429939 [Drosophila montana]|uniref:uncharacterized protein LOC135429939 n=1 Tax=Drosophila montana TaxID=40370 RepID=UPI00313B4C16
MFEQQQQQHDAADQTKRNDVHYLLKQLNSFSDIEEIEIVDMKQRKQPQPQSQQQQQQQRQQQQPSQRTSKAAAACSSSLELMPMSRSMLPLALGSPSTQSHKGNFMEHAGLGGDSNSSTRLQFDDYLFESCHYLETNYFAATYRTAMVESSSHEFRPSTATPPASVRSDSFELHELQPSSVICKAAAPARLDAGSPPPYQAEVRMTSSGVQTELTVESLAQLSNGSSSSGASSGGSPHLPPLFICCYTPIDRWRARRLGAAAAAKRSNPEKHGHPV